MALFLHPAGTRLFLSTPKGPLGEHSFPINAYLGLSKRRKRTLHVINELLTMSRSKVVELKLQSPYVFMA
jgi:hypothetical protein